MDCNEEREKDNELGLGWKNFYNPGIRVLFEFGERNGGTVDSVKDYHFEGPGFDSQQWHS